MDLRTVAQSGVDPSSGRYLSKEERIAAFRKGMQNKGKSVDPESFFNKKKVSDYATGKPNAIVKRDEVTDETSGALAKQESQPEVISKLEELKKLFEQLLSIKSERVKLESQYVSAKKRLQEKESFKKEESKMESNKTPLGKPLLKKLNNAVTSATAGLFGILQSILEYAVLDWISKPENKKMVEAFVKGFSLLFKFFDFYIGTMVDNLLGGFTRLFGGGSILERVFGGLKLLLGIFMLRRVMNPLLIIKDIKWIFKNIGNFKKLFDALKLKDLGKVGDSLKNIFPKFAKLFKHGLKRSVNRLFLSIFGKGITGFIKPILKSITRVVVKPLAKAVTRVPVLGPLLAIPINMFLGDPIDKAAVKAVGAGLGSVALGALGSIVPGAGTAIGAFAGGLLGDWLAGWLYDSVLAPLGKTLFGGGGKTDQPQLNTGGIAQGPDEGYPVTLHGTEAVIPIDQFTQIGTIPFKAIGSEIIGGTMSVVKSMGPVGALLSPVAQQTFTPYIKEFGMSTETFSTTLGKVTEKDVFKDSAALDESSPIAGRDEMLEKNNERAAAAGAPGADDQTVPTEPDTSPGTKVMSKSSGEWGPLLDLIASKESGGNYEAMYPSTTLRGATKMTIAEVARRATGAVGKYQQLPRYLVSRAKAAGLDPNKDLYDQKNQDLIAGRVNIGQNRGGNAWLSGKKTDEKFMHGLAYEFAALPGPDGKFKYKGQGSSIKPTDVRNALKQVREKSSKKMSIGGHLPLMSQGGKTKSSTGEDRKTGSDTKGSNANHIYLTRLDDRNIKKAYAPPGYCVTGSLETMQKSGVPNPAGTGADVGNNPRGAVVQLIKSFGWQSIGGTRTTLKSPYGTVTTGVFSKNEYAKAVDSGKVPSGALVFQTRHPDWHGTSAGSRGFDMAIAQKKGRGLWNGQPLGQWVYGNTKQVIALTPGGKAGDGSAPALSDSSGTSPSSSSSGSSDTNEQVEATPMISDDDLKYLFEALTGKTPTESKSSTKSSKPTILTPPPAPKLPNPSAPMPAGVSTQSKPSMLPGISSSYALEKKLMSQQSQPVVIVNSSTSMTSIGSTAVPLNNTTVTETNNLSKI